MHPPMRTSELIKLVNQAGALIDDLNPPDSKTDEEVRARVWDAVRSLSAALQLSLHSLHE